MADRAVKVRLEADISQFKRQLAEAAAATQLTGRATERLGSDLRDTETQAGRTGSEIDKLSGRLRLFTDAALIAGPALAPLSAFAVGGLVTMAAQLGSLAGALGVTVLAVNGLGDGLGALDAYQLEPTTANLQKMNQEMEKLGPAGRNFVHALDQLEPDLKKLQNSARAGLLPGAEEGIDALLTRLPELRHLIRGTAETLGDLAADAGKSLGGENFDSFLNYLSTDGIKILDDTSRTIGNLTEAAVNLFAAFAPVQTDFSGGLLDWSKGLAEASRELQSNTGFQQFLAYIQDTGPQVVATLGALANAVLQIVVAAAPLGGPVLQALEGIANAFSLIAGSDLGTPIIGALAALALYNRGLQLSTKLTESTWGSKATAGMKSYTSGLFQVISAQERAQMTATELDAAQRTNWGGMAKGAAKVGGLALAMSGLADDTGLSNAAMLSILGPWGTAAGAAIDLMHATDGLQDSIVNMNAAMRSTDASQIVAALNEANTELEKAQANTILGTSFLGDSLGGIANFTAPLSNTTKFMGNLTGETDKAAEAQAKLQKHLEEVRNGTYRAVGTLGDFAHVLDESTKSAQEEAQALQDSVDAMREKRQEALRALNAELNYQAAIDDANESIKENGKNFDITTEKGRANRQTLYALADGWNQQSDAAKNAKGSLSSARQNFIDTATQMGATAEQAKRLADRLFEIPPKRETKVTADTGQAQTAIQSVLRMMGLLHDKDLTITTHYNKTYGGQAGGGGHSKPDPADTTAHPRRTPRRLNPADVYTHLSGNNTGSLMSLRTSSGSDPAPTDDDAPEPKGGGKAGKHHWRTDFVASAYALRMLQKALDEATKSVDKNKKNLDDLTSAQDALISAVGGAYSKADLFSGGLSEFDAGTQANTNDTDAANSALATAVSNGLDGALYDALAKSGNLTLLQQFAGLSAAEIDAREKAFAAQSNAQNALGMSASQAEGLPAAIAAQTKELREAQKERRQQAQLLQRVQAQVERIGDRVEKGARAGVGDRDGRTHAQVRTGWTGG